jgi:plastocyanin
MASCVAIGLAILIMVPAIAATKSVSIQNFAFTPSSLSVHIGDTVKWTNNEGGTTHTVTADGRSFDSGNLSPGQSYSFMFTHTGTFGYHCNIHPYMTGSVSVTSATPSTSPTPTKTTKSQPSPTPTRPRSTSATATAKPTVVPVSPTPTSSAKPSPRASITKAPAGSVVPSASSSRIEAAATGSTKEGGGVIAVWIGLIAVAVVGGGAFAIRARRTRM